MDLPACPRCGYDLSGQLGGYREACPLKSVCSECGCEFEWKHLVGQRQIPAWFVENNGARLLPSLILTVLRTLILDEFWERVQMEHPIRLRRAFLAAVCVYALFGVVVAGVLGIEWAVASDLHPNWTATHPIGQEHAFLRTAGGLAFPFSSRVIAPDSFEWDPWWAWRARQTPANEWRLASLNTRSHPQAAMPFLALVTIPIMFLIVSDTRRRYKVRAVHIWRIALYASPPIMVMSFVAVGFDCAFVSLDGRPWGASNTILAWASPFVLLGWATLWWSVAAKMYLRIPNAFCLAAPLVFAGVLGAFTAQWFLTVLRYGWTDGLDYLPGFG